MALTRDEITAPGIYVIDLGRANLKPKNFRLAVDAIKRINQPWQGYREDGSYGQIEPDGSATFDAETKLWTIEANGERTIKRLLSVRSDFANIERA